MRRSESLRRRSARRQPRRRFTLFCEGEKTEPAYFDALQKLYADALIRIHIRPAAGVPMTIARLASEEVAHFKKRKKDSYEENDEIWAVFDRDAHPGFKEAVEQCQRAGVKVARSNPCFELWLILHYCDYNAPAGRHKAQRHLSRVCTSYSHKDGKGIDGTPLMEAIELAEERASRQLQARTNEGDELGEPSTTVGYLTAAVRAAAEEFLGRRKSVKVGSKIRPKLTKRR